MRYVLAIVALAISGVLLLLGIGQRTFLAGPSEIVYSIAADDGAPYAVLDVTELEKIDGQANIVMRGEDAFTALANTRDAAGWLSPFDHDVLTVDPKSKLVEKTTVRGTPPANDALPVDDNGNAVPIDPRGSDLWLDERTGAESSARMAVKPVPDQSIIIAGENGGPIPKGSAIVWVQDRATPWAGPLLAAGGLFAALGAVLYLIAFDRDKRALGPRRGRKGPFVGVQNVFTPSPKRGRGAASELEAPRRGSLDNTSSATAIAAGAAAGAAAALDDTTDRAAADADAAGVVAVDAETVAAETVAAEVVDGDVVEAEVVETDVVAADVAEADVVETDVVEVDPAAVDSVDIDPVDTDPLEADPVDTDEADGLVIDEIFGDEILGDDLDGDDLDGDDLDGDASETDHDSTNRGDGNAK